MSSDSDDDAPVLLFVDILGAKAVWSKEGCDGATLLFDRFADLVADEVRTDADRVESGAVETDSAALICRTPADAVSVGMGLYQRAFFKPTSARTERLWLRG